MQAYQLIAEEEVLKRCKPFFDIFAVTVYDDGTVTAPSIPKTFATDRPVYFTLERNLDRGTLDIRWQQCPASVFFETKR